MKKRKFVLVEPKSTHLHVYSRYTIPRLGVILLGTMLRDRGWDVRVYIEDVSPVDMTEVLSADIVGISTLTSTAPQSYKLAELVRNHGIPVIMGGLMSHFARMKRLIFRIMSSEEKGRKLSSSFLTPWTEKDLLTRFWVCRSGSRAKKCIHRIVL
ncbi:cobalamin B12-binding domain-containing protein [Leptospirillum ferriphilum]|uniref:cobalamin B12-binding domain-containing protein n=1 Tax=Leptospirillum ferriphilum TaxID=178606 RepID=UPI001FD20DD3|nr:cobalamin B12-binding domain-containing protein [Leptospirillum ferriphilum]